MRHPSQIGAAVIGAGFIGTVHVETLRRHGVQVHGVLASTPERSAAAARRLGLNRGYASLDDLLADTRVEIVHVTSPNHLHHPQVSRILAAGRHVVCEKPLAMTSGESEDLVRQAERASRVAAVNFNIRFYPLNLHVRDLVADGRLGDVRLVTGHYLQDWLLLDTDWNWRLDPELGGALRTVGDIGSHWLDLVSSLTGLRVTEVVADLPTFIPTRRQPKGPVETFSTERSDETVERSIATEDAAVILLRFENGARGSVALSQVSAGRKNALRYEIDGSVGSVSWDSEQPDQLWIGHRDGPNEVLIRNPALLEERGRAAAHLPGGHVEGFADAFRGLFEAIYADVATGRPDPAPAYPTFADGHAAVRIGEAIATSARQGRWTAVEPPTGAGGSA